MPHQRRDCGVPQSFAVHDQNHNHNHNHDLSRRTLLRMLGLGGASAAFGITFPARERSAFAQATPDVPAPEAPKRAPGGPDLDQLLLDLEYDSDKIFRFVADDIDYEAYSGVLRGAKGTYWSLAGNSADKAMLLAELLTQAQVTIRFAAGTLDDGIEDQLRSAMQIDAAAARTHVQRVASSSPPQLDRYPGLTADQRAALQSPQDLRKRLLDRASTHLQNGVDTIQTALAGEAIALPVPKPELPDRERRQHVWVQYADGPRWVDLDPSIAGSEPGKAYARQTETWDTVDAVPEDLFHRVRFRAIVETNVSGVPEREDAFVHESRAADLVGVPVVFAHVDPNALAKLGVSIGGILEGTTQYVPTLLAGAEGESGTPITLGGGGGALDVLGDAGSGDSGPLGEWLEVVVVPTDGPEQAITREVFDRIGIDRRAAGNVDLASIPPIELIDDPKLGNVFLPMEAVWLFGVVGGSIPGAYFDQDYAIPDIEADMALLVNGYHAARDGLQSEIAASYGYRWYPDQPNLTAAILAPVMADAAVVALSASLDLVHQGYAMVPLAGATPAAPPRVVAGVLAQVAEQMGAEAGAEFSPESPPQAGNVTVVFEQAAQAGVAIRTFRPDVAATPAAAIATPVSPRADVSALAISDVAKARISEALAAGYVVIVPERATDPGGVGQVGWWQVDPGTGRTFDLMENGRGGSPMGEDTVIIVGGPAWRAATAIKALYFVMGFVIAFSVAMAITMYPN